MRATESEVGMSGTRRPLGTDLPHKQVLNLKCLVSIPNMRYICFALIMIGLNILIHPLPWPDDSLGER